MITFTVVEEWVKSDHDDVGDCDFDDFFSISVAESCSWQSATHDLPHSGTCTNMYHCSILVCTLSLLIYILVLLNFN